MRVHKTRREFIGTAATMSVAGLFAGHLLMSEASASPVTRTELIKDVKLGTSAEIAALIAFYHDKMGLEVIRETANECSFLAGSSTLTFVKTEENDAPFYHFAFNIPENKIKYAEEWHASRSAFIQPPPYLLDERYQSKNVVHFRRWNAHSLFFYDPAGNVVEYIARHTIENSATGSFTPKDILYLSEIGLVANDVTLAANSIAQQTSLSPYFRASEKFTALGDEYGLIILFKEDTKEVFDAGKDRKTFKAQISINSDTNFSDWQVENYPFWISGNKNP